LGWNRKEVAASIVAVVVAVMVGYVQREKDGGWNYVVAAHKPTNATHSCMGSFTNPLDQFDHKSLPAIRRI
jgi:hypothetical protein